MPGSQKARFEVIEQVDDSAQGLDGSCEEVSIIVPQLHSANHKSTNESSTNQKSLYLYEDDIERMPLVSTFLKSLEGFGQHTTYPTEKTVKETKKQPKQAKLGLILGVYLPTIQHIFGVLIFVRLAWIVGSMGLIESFLMVFVCCLTTFVTSISMSAIATNGVVQAGGSYFMISRNLGPECGGAVGICFYLANTFAADLYLLGALEILLQYMAPGLCFFGDIHKNPWNNYRIYGTVAVLILTLVVGVGVKFVAYFAPVALISVIFSILCCYIGAFEANEKTRDIWLCMLGNKLLVPPHTMDGFNVTGKGGEAEMAAWCNKEETGDLFHRYCLVVNETEHCDSYYTTHEVAHMAGIPGMFSGVAKDNLWSYYLEEGEAAKGIDGELENGEVVQDITTSFVVLCAIYFPSVTGIMTGSNMSGDLKDPQKSIPVGTILAQLTCSFVYLSLTVFYGVTGAGPLLRDKYGHSQHGQLYAAAMAWPHYWVVLIGAFCSTLGAALQCLTSAPRLLQAIARDDIIPFLDVFRVTTKKGEPLRALILTALIAEIGILIARLDYVAPLIDVCFLMCYGFVNLTVALQTLLKSPHWRPRFRYYHWTLSILGVVLNLALSITAGWYFALSAFAIAGFVYKYVEYKGSEKEWGDGVKGLSMSAAQRALVNLDEEDPHTKNWRPQILVLVKMDPITELPKYPQLFSFARQLKAGQGLTVCCSVIEGDYMEQRDAVDHTRTVLKNHLESSKVKGFVKVMATNNITEGINIFIQTVGLGGMKHNSVMLGYPCGWKQNPQDKDWKVFLETLRVAAHKELAILIPRGIEHFPDRKEKLTGTIDVWWIVHDGGMLILLSFLLMKHKTWRQCKLRLFTVAQMEDNSIQLRKDLENFLYQLRIKAEVHVEEMYDSDISAYTVERTLDMEKRSMLLRELSRHKKRRGTDTTSIQEIVDLSHHASHVTGVKGSPQRNQSAPHILIHNINGATTTQDTAVEADSNDNLEIPVDQVYFTFSAPQAKAHLSKMQSESTRTANKQVQISDGKLMKMHTAVRLNETIRNKSCDAALVIINFPAPPMKSQAEQNYMHYLDALSDNLTRVLLVRGSGREVVTMYS